MTKLRAAFLVLQCTLCLTIRVPVIWNDNSGNNSNEQLSPAKQPVQAALANIPQEYFEYSANKPQFAIDVAASHGVNSPEKHYSSYPVNPYTGFSKPTLGHHLLLDQQNEKFHPYQAFVSDTQSHNYVKPTSTSFEIYHPYKAEEPALQEIYRDPVLNKIRDDLRDSKNRLQKYESEAGEPNIEKEEYLESPEETDRRYQPHKNIPVKYEIHRPLRRPNYYRPPNKSNYRENVLNKKLKHPLYQNYAKIAPIHYHPVKNHLQQLRQQHALKFDDEHNEYPQLLPPEPYAEKPDGYDIYEKGKDKFIKLRNNVDESINKVAQENSASNSQKLELQYEDDKNEPLRDQDDEFVPIKNYAQVRKTETTKHLPREKAFEDADNYDEIKNAPRLREAIKSTKAQIVYSEEGYEDSAYDHAGEQKHASDHEGHGGHLKENEHSKGKYKIPSISYNNDDAKGSAYRDQVLHGEKWQDDKKDTENESELEDYSENEHDVVAENDNYSSNSDPESTQIEETIDEPENLSNIDSITLSKIRNKRQDANDDKDFNHENRQIKNSFVPEINLNSIFVNPKQNFSRSNLKDEDIKSQNNLILKYPYYFRDIIGVNKDSPLRYAENLNLIPKKSHGGTEFYDSRSSIACSEVEEVDPIPEALKKGENPSGGSTKENEFKRLDEKQRLKGLGDKIDCFKAKYFGENPLDSPFFNEDIISNPKPVIKPNLDIFDTKYTKKHSLSTPNHENLNIKNNENKNNTLNVYEDIILPSTDNQHRIFNNTSLNIENSNILTSTNIPNQLYSNVQEELQKNQKDDIQIALISRKKRATSFVYEPYKIIKESQVQDSKKTTTTSNISPLIKQLQSSRIVDRGNIKHKEHPMKRNTKSKVYQDIDKAQRPTPASIETSDQSHISIDKRRGEPRYDLQHPNHKAYYTPVENKASMSLEDYVEKTNDQNIGIKTISSQPLQRNLRRNTKFSNVQQVPIDSSDIQNIAASNAIKNVLHATTPSSRKTDMHKHSSQDNDEDEEYEEYDSDVEHDSDKEHKNTIKVTTPKTLVSRRQHESHKMETTTGRSIEDESDYIHYNNNKEPKSKPKLELITRFRDTSISNNKNDKNNNLLNINHDSTHNESSIPKYREKKKKMTKSTLVTDTKTYGEDDDDDMRKDEVDAMIGVQHNEEDYMPSYERSIKNKAVTDHNGNVNTARNPDEDEEEEEEDEDVEDERNKEIIEDEKDDDEEEDDEDNDDDDDEDDDEDDDDEVDDDDNIENHTIKNDKNIETLEKPTKNLPKPIQILQVTTEPTTKEIELIPKILRKEIEIHKEIPINKSSPHISQYKQDIKEIEIIKEVPQKAVKPHQENVEALELYKDENLAKDINKLGGVEIFKENLDLKAGPRHGGNYRSIEDISSNEKNAIATNAHKNKGDVEASQSETRKLVESQKTSPLHTLRRNTRISQNSKTKYPDETRNAKITEFKDEVDPTISSMHGGNLKLSNRERSRGNKNAKYIELNDDDDDDEVRYTSKMHGGNFKSYGGRRNDMHGGNYKSAKIIQPVDIKDDLGNAERKNKQVRQKIPNEDRNNAAALLSGYARAVPILTTTPNYILDPSKRMYYYVDT